MTKHHRRRIRKQHCIKTS